MAYMGSVEKKKEATFRESFSFHKGLDKHKAGLFCRKAPSFAKEKKRWLAIRHLRTEI